MVSDNSRIARMHIERSNDSYVVEISMWLNFIRTTKTDPSTTLRVTLLSLIGAKHLACTGARDYRRYKNKHILTDRRQAFGLRTDAQAFRLVLERATMEDTILTPIIGQSSNIWFADRRSSV